MRNFYFCFLIHFLEKRNDNLDEVEDIIKYEEKNCFLRHLEVIMLELYFQTRAGIIFCFLFLCLKILIINFDMMNHLFFYFQQNEKIL